MNEYVTVVGDVLNFCGRIGETGASPSGPNRWVRLRGRVDKFITAVGDVLTYRGMIEESRT